MQYCNAQTFSLVYAERDTLQCVSLEVPRLHERPAHPEATMELRTRMNVLAALLSFGFVAAIVFGMI
jgi:hypothetical protein